MGGVYFSITCYGATSDNIFCNARSFRLCQDRNGEGDMSWKSIIALVALSAAILFLAIGGSSIERKLLFFPTHRLVENGLKPWTNAGDVIGYSRQVDSPKNVWLLLHGNAGQASDRSYAIASFSTEDSVFILEYPGYGLRKGKPSKDTFNQAAKEAYVLLRKEHPNVPVCVTGESIGSGPASSLAALNPPPHKLALIVPFDKLSLVAKDHFPSLLVSLILRDNWDNTEALSHYKGPIDIFGAEGDTIIPMRHAKALAAAVPSARLVTIAGGHNDWSRQSKVCIRNP
jgi:uncharacterized protein